jgi:SUKH-4 immunity protein of toxin-antitoxin system
VRSQLNARSLVDTRCGVPLEHLTPSEFRRRWPDTLATEFVRYPRESFLSLGLSESDRDWLADVGFPAFAAPNFYFFFDGGSSLPAATDPYGQPLPDAPQRLRMFGSTGENWPICIDPDRNAAVCCLDIGPTYRVLPLNSSICQLAASLAAYGDAVEDVLRLTESQGESDGWRRRKYPPKYDRQLQERLRRIDDVALAPGAYWAWHLAEHARVV